MSNIIKEKSGRELAEMEARLYTYEGEDKMVSSEELWDKLQKEAPNIPTNKTGFPSMDRILSGVEPGELVVVTGPSGEGKTTLLMSITKNMAEKGVESAWFTLEVTQYQFLKKIGGGGVMPHFYLPSKNADNTLKWIEDRVIEAKLKYEAKVIFIDHLHSIFSLARMNARSNLSLEIGDLAAKIKNLALEHQITIFLIAHMTDDKDNPTREPRKEDIRDSGMIIREADTIIAVWRINNEDTLDKNRKPTALREGDTKAKVRILKNRREGKLGTFIADWDNHQFREFSFDDHGL